MKHSDWVKTLKSDPQTISWMMQNWSKIPEAKRKLLTDLKDGKKIKVMHNALGEDFGMDAYVDEVIKPLEGGSFVKLYGISYLRKGQFDGYKVMGMGMAKGLLSMFVWRIVGKSYIYLAAVALKFLLLRKAFIRDAEIAFREINTKVLGNGANKNIDNLEGFVFDIPAKEYNQAQKEYRRAIDQTLKEVKTIWNNAISLASRFIIFFLEFDSQYGLRIQDALGSGGNFFECLDRLISREDKTEGIGNKWKSYRRMAKMFLFLAPDLRKFIDRFMENLDRDRVKMDEADWYFCLSSKGYNYGGINHADRQKLKEQADKEKGHTFLI